MPSHTPANASITVTRHHTQAELEAKKREAQERREAAERNYKEKAVTIPFKQLNKNVEQYEGDTVTYTGQIFQIHEEGEGGWMLVSVTKEEFGIWTDEVYVNFTGHVKGAEKDLVTFWGTVTGTKSYETKIGGNNEVPEITAKYVEG